MPAKTVRRQLSILHPALENDRLYKPVDSADPEVQALAQSILEHGLKEPFLITSDNFIISGHRRRVACGLAGLESVPCQVEPILHSDPRFLTLLRECNRQRVKTFSEVLREEVVSANPEEAYRVLRRYRARQADVDADTIPLNRAGRRASISAAKQPLLNAIIGVVNDPANVGRLSVRQIFYRILNLDPLPLLNADRPESVYGNNLKSYKAVDELSVRARLTGDIPFGKIQDNTRPVVNWSVHRQPGTFVAAQLDKFLKGYYRDLLQSQPNHVEIVGEKNTIEGIIRSPAMEYTLPYTIGRGYASLPPRRDMAVRFRESGKEKLVLLFLADFDPEGEDIGRAFGQSMRDDFGIKNVVPIKVALTGEQVKQLGLHPNLTAKKTSSRRKGFVEKHGEHVYELEAVSPATLQQYLRDAIDQALDVDKFNAEIESEKRDAAFLEDVRRKAHSLLAALE